jgi:hypothetical protein
MDAARHEIVARAFGCPPREHRRLDLEKAHLRHRAADVLSGAMAEVDRVLQLVAPQIEIAITQPQIFRRQLIAGRGCNQNRRRLRGIQNRHLGDVHFDFAGRHIGIAGVRGPQTDVALHLDDVLGAEACGLRDDGSRRPLRIERELHAATTIAQVDEDDAAEVATLVHPP